MNYHEALGRFVEMKEQIEAKRMLRRVLLSNLAHLATRDLSIPFDFAAARAMLNEAEQAQVELIALEPQLQAVAQVCGKRI